jgi:hypothetical protein
LLIIPQFDLLAFKVKNPHSSTSLLLKVYLERGIGRKTFVKVILKSDRAKNKVFKCESVLKLDATLNYSQRR